MKTPAAVQLLLPEMDGTAGFYEARTDRVLCVRCAGPPAPGAAPIPEANCGDLHSALARRPEGGRRSFRSTTAGRVAAMAPSSILDSVYERAASFGRDVFHYMVTGTMFAVVCSVPWWSDTRWEEVRESSQIVLLFVAATVLFGLGHVLFAIGFWIRNKIIRPDQNWVFRAQMEKYRRAIDRTRQALPGNLVVGDEPAENVHVGLEMSVLLKQPRLHAIFIERYNTLWHLRLGLAASFLVAGFVNLAVAIYSLVVNLAFATICSFVVNLAFAICSFDATTCCPVQGVPVVIGIVGVVSILLGLLLTHQHLVTNTNFLHRVIVAFNVGEQTKR